MRVVGNGLPRRVERFVRKKELRALLHVNVDARARAHRIVTQERSLILFPNPSQKKVLQNEPK